MKDSGQSKTIDKARHTPGRLPTVHGMIWKPLMQIKPANQIVHIPSAYSLRMVAIESAHVAKETPL